MGKGKKLHSKTYEGAAEWFDTHDMSDYKEQMGFVDFHFDLRRNRDLVELDREIAKHVRKVAKDQNVPTRRLVNEWLKERLRSFQ